MIALGNHLEFAKGVIHVGANTGQERNEYHEHNLPVIWVEPVLEVYRQLLENISKYPEQVAFNDFISDKDGESVVLHVSNNNGESSSRYALNLHSRVWPDVKFVRDITVVSKTLHSLMLEHGLPFHEYNCLVVDTQGSELKVLDGAWQFFHRLDIVCVEVPTFDSYSGCCQRGNVEWWMDRNGFRLVYEHKFADTPGVGAYYDLVYERNEKLNS